jgi:hypothetical protein
MADEILAIDRWGSNADLVVSVVQLGYLSSEVPTLDPTYGYGTWWKKWAPRDLQRHDLDPAKAPDGPMDFTSMPYLDASFGAVTFDPPYKMNGTATEADERYGVHQPATWQGRLELMRLGMTECARVLKPRGRLLVKCQQQVSSGEVRWQDFEMHLHGLSLGLKLEDRFDMLGHRPQPINNPNGTPRRQVHARRNASTLLVFRAPR